MFACGIKLGVTSFVFVCFFPLCVLPVFDEFHLQISNTNYDQIIMCGLKPCTMTLFVILLL